MGDDKQDSHTTEKGQEEPPVNPRNFFRALTAAPAISLYRPQEAAAELPKAKVTRVRIFVRRN